MNWNTVINFANNGTPAPDKRVEKTPEQWKALLTPEQFQITRLKQTERPHSGEFCSIHSPGVYACICCGTRFSTLPLNLNQVQVGRVLPNQSLKMQ